MINLDELYPYTPLIFCSRDVSYPPRYRKNEGIRIFDNLVKSLAEISEPTNPNLMGMCFSHGALYGSRSTHLYCDKCLEYLTKRSVRIRN